MTLARRALLAVSVASLAWSIFIFRSGGFFFRGAGVRFASHSSLPAYLIAVGASLGALLISAAPGRRAPASPASRGRTAQTVVRGGLVLLLFTSLTAAMTYPQIRRLSTGVVDAGDPFLNAWTLAWVAHQLPRDPGHLFDGNIFYPEKATLTYSEALIGESLIAAPVMWLSGGPILAHNIVLILGFVLSGAGTSLLVYSLTRQAGAAVFAGIVFAFLPYRFAQYAHVQLLSAQWMPLTLWAAHQMILTERPLFAGLTGAFFALNALTCMYYGVFLGTFLPVIAGVLLIGRWRRGLAMVPLVALASFVVVLMLAPFAAAYLQHTQVADTRVPVLVQQGQARPVNYLAVPRNNAVYGKTLERFGADEKYLFPGMLALALALYGLWPPLSTVRLAYGVGLLFALNSSLGFDGLGYGWLYDHILPYRGIRVPARWGVLVGLSVAVLSGFGLGRLTARLRSRTARGALVVVACGLALIEYAPRELNLIDAPTELPAPYERFRGMAPTVLIELPLDQSTYAMYFSTFHWQNIVNGYSGIFPVWFYPLYDAVDHDFPNERALAQFREHQVEYLLVHRGLFRFDRRNECARIVEALDHQAGVTLLGTYVLHDAETRVYHLDPAEAHGPSAAR